MNDSEMFYDPWKCFTNGTKCFKECLQMLANAVANLTANETRKRRMGNY